MREIPVAAALVAAFLTPLAGCARTDQPASVSPTATPLPSASTTPSPGGDPASHPPGVEVVLTKSGGIAGLQETVTVRPDGHWTRVDRGGTSRTGQLDAKDLDRLRQLTADRRLATEATDTSAPMCADAFTYQLTVGPISTGYVDCPPKGAPPATTAAVVELLTRATE